MKNWLRDEIDLLLLKVFERLFFGHRTGGRFLTGGRSERWREINDCEIRLVASVGPYADRVCGREEVYELLKVVRRNERRMNWHCPEPLEESEAAGVPREAPPR